MKRAKRKIKRNHGFTLIELAIMLVIVGVLVGLGAGMVGPLTRQSKFIETRRILDAGMESIFSYGAGNNKLPVTADFSSTVKNPNDALQKPLYYVVDNNLTDSSIGGICGRKTTKLSIDMCPDAACGTPTSTINDVAFLILSGDGNYNNQTAGTQAVSVATTVNVYEVDVNVDSYAGDMNRVEPYDDLVKWSTLNELRAKSGCVGPQLKIVNNELPYGFESSGYSASIYGSGGVAFADGAGDPDTEKDYEWCWKEDPVKLSPPGITFTCNGSVTSSAACTLTSGTWGQCTSMTLTGTPTATNNYLLTFFIRDENDSSGTNDNIAEKTLVLTINPAAGGGGGSCSDYRVWNDLGINRDFDVDGNCGKANNGTEITSTGTSELLNSGEDIKRYGTWNNSCGTLQETFTFNDAVTADTNLDCCVNFTGADRTCP